METRAQDQNEAPTHGLMTVDSEEPEVQPSPLKTCLRQE
uniref:Uncharacterized protein n=1 Tax=Anguilla anguilla TaxID=7936 RepID=A0A0E9XTQ5_ANGAN